VFDMIKELIKYRELLWSLSIRDMRVRYKQTLLGVFWAFFSPLCMMIISTFTFSKIAKVDTGDIPYPIFVYCGLLPWSFFASALKLATTSLVANPSLITKIYFPREVFPLSVIASWLIDFFISLGILFGLMVYFKVSFHWTILLMPVVLFVQILFMIGLGFFLSMGNLFYRDVKYVFEVFIMLWMFVTSVIYPIKTDIKIIQNILMFNPMTPIIDAYRDVLIRGVVPDVTTLALPIAIILAVFFSGWFWFHKVEFLFAENI
jgi:lipopolysaccharide transport system permease protein